MSDPKPWEKEYGAVKNAGMTLAEKAAKVGITPEEYEKRETAHRAHLQLEPDEEIPYFVVGYIPVDPLPLSEADKKAAKVFLDKLFAQNQ